MKQTTRLSQRMGAAAVVAASTAVGLVALAPLASAEPNCGPSTHIDEISIETYADKGYEDQFKIIVDVKDDVRRSLDPRGVIGDIFHAIQDCVPGIVGPLADSVWDQLECHQHLAGVPRGYTTVIAGRVVVPTSLTWFTGDTYDLESWRGEFGVGDWLSSKCGNEYNVLHLAEPETSNGTYRPDRTTSPATPAEAPIATGFHIQDSFYGGTWARLDPDEGGWHSKDSHPANGKYWFPDGLGIAVDCTRQAAPYTVAFADGHRETWSNWAHITDSSWVPVAVLEENVTDNDLGRPRC